MTVTVVFTKEQESLLQREAQKRGVNIDVVVRELVDSALKTESVQTPPHAGLRVMGIHAGTVSYIAPDFDAELPDSYWLGEN